MSSELIISDNVIPINLCTGAMVLPFINGKILLSHVLKRGYDIIGGHIENNETPIETLKREAIEEAGITLTDIKQLGYKRYHITNPPNNYIYPTPYSYIMFYTGIITNIQPHTMVNECGVPKLFTHQEAMKERAILDHIQFYFQARRLNNL